MAGRINVGGDAIIGTVLPIGWSGAPGAAAPDIGRIRQDQRVEDRAHRERHVLAGGRARREC